MSDRRNSRLALVATVASALLFGAAQPALAYFDNYLSGSIVGTLTKKEAASLQQAVRKALNETEDNQSVEWHYPAEGRRQAVDGTISPIATKTDKGQSCRRLKSELQRGGATEAWSGWFCKQADGKWKARQVAD
ncbi:RT0821/Lpp0805 family surface protein [Cupriavidus sp. BIS7]|jgi:surface antigen|uniref:RT0821/Lpp0805 family surface protein n=1 Tax=Cupriavidus sp. BIS7 TaxID=1217718 RepID=UPI00030E7451|nr:RT0821/Lpp0805 family surface protein [Cupriavidus sp. BIS7]